MAIRRRSIEIKDEETKALAYRVTIKEHTEFRGMCKKEGLTISAMLERIVGDFMSRRKK